MAIADGAGVGRLLFLAVACSGCAAAGPLIQLGAELAIDSVVLAARASEQARYEEQREPEPEPIERIIERSRLRLAIRYDAVDAPPCRVTSYRTGQRTWRLDSCDAHLECHAMPNDDFACTGPRPEQAPLQL